MSSTTSTAAICWQINGKSYIRLYICDGQTVTEHVCDKGHWSIGSFRQLGQTVSASSTAYGEDIHVYCVNGAVINEWIFTKSGWVAGQLAIPYSLRHRHPNPPIESTEPEKTMGYIASSATVAWKTTFGGTHVRVFVCDGANIIEKCQDNSDEWTDGLFNWTGQHVSAAIDNAQNINVFCTDKGKVIHWRWEPDKGFWERGNFPG